MNSSDSQVFSKISSLWARYSNAQLCTTAKRLVAEERHKTLEVLECVQEIHRRRVHLSLGFSSLHEYLVRELAYTDGAAHRRIAAMKLTEEIPEAKESLASGALSLSTASVMYGFLRSERQEHRKIYSKAQKLELLNALQGTTKDECIAKLKNFSPTYVAKEEIKIPKDQELMDLWRIF